METARKPAGEAPGTIVREMTRQERILAAREKKKQANPIIDLMVIFIILRFIGFPGRLTRMFGGAIESLTDYGSFGLQLGICMITSGSDYLDIKLLNFHRKYWAVYLYVFLIIGIAMVIVPEKKEEAITCFRLLTTASFAMWVADRYDTATILELSYYATILMMGSIMLYTVRYPGSAYSYYDGSKAFVGLVGAKNSAGSSMAFLALLEIALLRIKLDHKQKPSKMFWGVTGLTCVLLLLSKATGALFTMMVASGYTLVLEKALGPKKRLPLGILFVVTQVGFLLFALTIIPLAEPLLNALGKDATLTGRIPMWNHLINMMLDDKTMLGYGYERFWKNETAMQLFHAGFGRTSWFATMTYGCHNLIMELWVNTGLVGVGAFFLMALIAMGKVRYMKEDDYIFCSSFLIMYILHSLTERGMSPGSYFTFYLFVALGKALNAKKPKKEIRKYGQSDNH